MVKTLSMTRNQNHDDDESLSSRKRFKAFDNGDVAPWADLNHDVFFLIMMQLGVVDFFALSGVCKSWRSFTLSNKYTFMASRPPMSISFSRSDYRKDFYCYPEDFERRRFGTIIPHSAGRTCIGVTCGYLILLGRETRDFWLVNPITRHELYFPNYPVYVGNREEGPRAILVFSPLVSACVFVVLDIIISICIEGKRGWIHPSSTLPIIDIHVFKGKIYTLSTDCCLRELRLNLKPGCNWTSLLEIKNLRKPNLFRPELVSSGENLYMVNRSYSSSDNHVLELDFGEMKWVLPEKIIGEYAFFLSCNKSSAAIKLESQCKSYNYCLDTNHKSQNMFYCKWMWYFAHDCLNVDLLDES